MYIDRQVGGLSALPPSQQKRQKALMSRPVPTVNLFGPFKSQSSAAPDPAKFPVITDSHVGLATGVSYPTLPPNLKTMTPWLSTAIRMGKTLAVAKPVAGRIVFPKPVANWIYPAVPSIKDRVVLGPTENAATLTNQMANVLPPTLSIMPPPPTTRGAVAATGMVQIMGPEVSNAELPAVISPGPPPSTGASSAGFPVAAGIVIVLLALGLFAGKK